MMIQVSAGRRRWLLAGGGALALVAAAVAAAPDAGAAPTPPGWTQVFADDFTGPAGAGVDTAHSLYHTGTGYPGGAAHSGTRGGGTKTSRTPDGIQGGH